MQAQRCSQENSTGNSTVFLSKGVDWAEIKWGELAKSTQIGRQCKRTEDTERYDDPQNIMATAVSCPSRPLSHIFPWRLSVSIATGVIFAQMGS
jgi:hypothetical protein